jgi:hypothetical protein
MNFEDIENGRASTKMIREEETKQEFGGSGQ